MSEFIDLEKSRKYILLIIIINIINIHIFYNFNRNKNIDIFFLLLNVYIANFIKIK